jgi:hypothetical protein
MAVSRLDGSVIGWFRGGACRRWAEMILLKETFVKPEKIAGFSRALVQ